MDKLNLEFLKKMQKGVDPMIKPGEVALETIKRLEAERVAQLSERTVPPPSQTPPQAPPQEVVFIEGHKLPRNFFTCLALCIIKLDNPEINEILEKFGFVMKDLDGKVVILKKNVKRKEKKRKNR